MKKELVLALTLQWSLETQVQRAQEQSDRRRQERTDGRILFDPPIEPVLKSLFPHSHRKRRRQTEPKTELEQPKKVRIEEETRSYVCLSLLERSSRIIGSQKPFKSSKKLMNMKSKSNNFVLYYKQNNSKIKKINQKTREKELFT